jgi:hypothetical protein
LWLSFSLKTSIQVQNRVSSMHLRKHWKYFRFWRYG